MKSKFIWAAGAAALAMLAAPVQAQEVAGKLQVKVLGTAVLPDGKITKVLNNAAGVPAGTQAYATDNVVPTLAVEYFFSPNFSVETICCLTAHHVNGAGALAGTNLVRTVKILPATLTLKAHMPLGPIKPYIGAGPTYFIFISEKSGTTTTALGLPKNKLNDKVGVALQAGVDVPLNANGLACRSMPSAISCAPRRIGPRPGARNCSPPGTSSIPGC